MRLSGKTALVTGAGRGIGREIALAYAREGSRVALVARSADELSAVASEIEALGPQALALPGDVTDQAFATDAIQQTQVELGPVDILVNNAGVFLERPVLETPLEEFDRVMDVNFRAPLRWMREAARGMIDRGQGLLLSISSQAGRRPYPGQGAYCASKHALMGLVRVLAWELREHGVRVSAISPGGVDTDLLAGAHEYADKSAYMQPEDIAEAAIYLATLPPRAAVDEIVIRRFAADPLP
jgi:3-oxoacyl-[acyl-carrier protein] reductase